MGVVVFGVLLRSRLRRRWRAWLAVTMLIGPLAGLAMSAAAGARRTNSVADRAIVAQRAFDVFMVPHYTDNGDRLDFDKIAAFPEVVEAVRAPLSGLQGTSAGREFESTVVVAFPGHGARIVVVAAGGLLFANLVASMPARTAARTPVALALRTE